jgi:hypothetical protein
MRDLTISFSVLILVIQWELNTRGDAHPSTWEAFFLFAKQLSSVRYGKEHYVNTSWETIRNKITIPCVKQKNLNFPASTDRIGLATLPTELIQRVLEYLDPNDCALYSLSVANKRLNFILDSILYPRPYLTSPASIYRYLRTIVDSNCIRASNSLTFGPSLSVGLTDRSKGSSIPHIPYVHSGLFTLLIQDRDCVFSAKNLVHPIFYQFGAIVPSWETIEEFVHHKEPFLLPGRRRPFFIGNSKVLVSKVASNSATLHNLFKICQKWHQNFIEWKTITSAPAFDTCILLLELFQGDFHPIWRYVGSEGVRRIKRAVMHKVRDVLTHVYSALLLQVRFVTSNSQRLLDSYCLLYYRVLALAQDLEIDDLVQAMGFTETADPALDENEIAQIIQQQHQRETQNTLDDSPTVPNLSHFSLPRSEPCELTDVQLRARMIYDALIALYRTRLPPSMLCNDIYPKVPFQLLRAIITNFPPSLMNGETLEFLTLIVDVNMNMQADVQLIYPWIMWFKEIIIWHECSREMEPVKDLLRKSMEKIDTLRTIQVGFINYSAGTV